MVPGDSYSEKASWGPGPWDDEPDRLQWIDQASDLDCLIVRGPYGALCGYVGVPPGHPWHGTSYGDLPQEVWVHGGLTYSAECRGDICHVPEPGRPHEVWWFGFDCSHFSDLAPRMAAMDRAYGFPPPSHPMTYKTADYVRIQCADLARQIRAADASG